MSSSIFCSTVKKKETNFFSSETCQKILLNEVSIITQFLNGFIVKHLKGFSAE